MAFDDLYQKTKNWLTSQNIDKTSKDTGLSKHYINKVINAMKSPDIFQLNQLGRVDGIGIKTLEKIFNIAYSSISEKPDTILVQPSLLD